MAGDASYASVSLLVHANGTNGAVTFPDTSSNAATPAVTNATVSTAQSKFGGASASLAGNGSIVYPANAAYAVGAGDFTMELFVRFNSLANSPHIIQLGGGSVSERVNIFVSASKACMYSQTTAGGGAFRITGGTTLVTGQWYHMALVRASGTWTLYLDGISQGTTTTTIIPAGNLTACLGTQQYSPAAGDYLNGYIDEVRITKGLARYTANFTPPTSAFHDGMGQVAGIVNDSTGAVAARTVRAYRRDTGAKVGADVVSSAVDGSYSFYTPTLDELTVIAIDNASSGTYYNDVAIRVIPA